MPRRHDPARKYQRPTRKTPSAKTTSPNLGTEDNFDGWNGYARILDVTRNKKIGSEIVHLLLTGQSRVKFVDRKDIDSGAFKIQKGQVVHVESDDELDFTKIPTGLSLSDAFKNLSLLISNVGKKKLHLRPIVGNMNDLVNARSQGNTPPQRTFANGAPITEVCELIKLAATEIQYNEMRGIDQAPHSMTLTLSNRYDVGEDGIARLPKVYFFSTCIDRDSPMGWTEGSVLAGNIKGENGPKRFTIFSVEVVKGSLNLELCIESSKAAFVEKENDYGEQSDSFTACLRLTIENLKLLDPLATRLTRLNINHFMPNFNGTLIVNQIYNGQSAQKVKPFEADTSWLFAQFVQRNADGSTRCITFDKEQMLVFAADDNPSNLILNLDAGAGAGKTTTICAAILRALKRDKNPLVIVVAETNAAVSQIVNTIDKFVTREPPSMIRFVSLCDPDIEWTKHDAHEMIPKIIEDVILAAHGGAKEAHRTNQRAFNQAMEEIRRLRSRNGGINRAQNFAFQTAAQRASNIMSTYIRALLLAKKPTVIAMTKTKLINALGPWSSKVGNYMKGHPSPTIWVDEASQMQEGAALVFAQILPNAKQRYVGDPAQLPPYCESDKKSFAARVGARSVSEVLLHAPGVPRLTLRKCRRCHPQLTSIASRMFYDGTLESGVTDLDRCRVRKALIFPHRKTPYALVDVRGSAQRAEGTRSKHNNREANVSIKLARAFANVVGAKEVAIICFYKDQCAGVRRAAGNEGYCVMTVDSSQGKEWEVVLVLTTHTATVGADFINDDKRINVAMTRARQACVVLGHADALRATDTWGKIVNISHEINTVLSEERALKTFCYSR